MLLSGKFEHIDNATFYLYNETGLYPHIDTLRLKGGEFEKQIKLTEPCVFTLQYPNYTQTHFIAEPGKDIEIKGSANALKMVDVSGTKQNERLSEFRIKTAKLPKHESILAAQQYIRDNIKDIDAAIIFRTHLVNTIPNDIRTLDPLLNLLIEEQTNKHYIQHINSFVRLTLQRGIGTHIPPFTTTTLQNKSYTFKDSIDRPTFIMVWAAWNNKTTKQLHQLIRLVNDYGKKVRYLSVSLDADSVRPTRLLHNNDTLRCPTLFDGKMFMSPLVYQLGIHSVPTNLLLDKNGRILERDIPLENIKQKIEETIK